MAAVLNSAGPYLLLDEMIQAPAALAVSSKAIGYLLLLTEQQLVNHEALLRHMLFHFPRTCLLDQVFQLDGIVSRVPPPGILKSIYEKSQLQEQLFRPAQWGWMKQHDSVLCQNNQ